VSSPEDGLRLTFASKARQVLPPIARDLVEALDLEGDPSHVEVVGQALARAFTEGTAVGATEAVAQATEQGLTLNLAWLGGTDKS
jgi:hypothetical protein